MALLHSCHERACDALKLRMVVDTQTGLDMLVRGKYKHGHPRLHPLRSHLLHLPAATQPCLCAAQKLPRAKVSAPATTKHPVTMCNNS